MFKPHDPMWTRLSRLQREFPAWISSRLTTKLPPRTATLPPHQSEAEQQKILQRACAQSCDTDDQTTALKADSPGTPAADVQAAESDLAAFAKVLLIPVCTDSPATRSRLALQDKGQFLARQDRWADLSKMIRSADQQHRRTEGGLPEADLLAYGARADVVNAVDHALQEPSDKTGPNGEDRILIEGVMALEALRREHRHDAYLTAIVALAHIDIAWVWRSTITSAASQADDGPRRDTGSAAALAADSTTAATPLSGLSSEAHLRRATAHFERAAALLAPLKAQIQNSAFLSAAHCALFAGQSAATLQVADAYAVLIDQDPNNPRPMRALGAQMLPRANGSYAALELEARRTAARTQGIWGAGGYTWVYFDAMAIDDRACARVDTKFFLEGMQDILNVDSSQEMVNLLSAYCAITLSQDAGRKSDQNAKKNRAQIAKAARWLIRSHLHELHPLIWAHACAGFDNNAHVASLRRFATQGQARALHCIAEVFRDELECGHKIAFTPDGIDLLT